MEFTIPEVLQPVLEIYGLQSAVILLAAAAVYFAVPYLQKVIGKDLLYGGRTDLVGLIVGIVAYIGLAKPASWADAVPCFFGGLVAYILASGKFKGDQAKNKRRFG